MIYAKSHGEISAASYPDRMAHEMLLGFGFARLCVIEDEEVILQSGAEAVEVSNPFPRGIPAMTYLELARREGGSYLVRQILL